MFNASARRRRRRGCGGSRAFTLVELLVVIAIVSILIAILLPVLSRVRRRAVVLASPVAYTRMDAGITIAHPTGKAELDIAPARTLCWNSRPQGPAWSTSGTYIGHTIHIGEGEQHYVAIVNPANGKVIRHDLGDRFCGWVDDHRFVLTGIGRGGQRFDVYDAESGQLLETFVQQDLRVMNAGLAPAASSSGACYVTASFGSDSLDIVLLKKDFSRQKTIYRDTSSPRVLSAEPRMDPFGDLVAWTMRDPTGGGYVIAVKPVKEATWVAPGLLRGNYIQAILLDWTEGGDLLAVVYSPGGLTLAVLDTKGAVKSQVPVDVAPYTEPGAGSWRKYLHR